MPKSNVKCLSKLINGPAGFTWLVNWRAECRVQRRCWSLWSVHPSAAFRVRLSAAVHRVCRISIRFRTSDSNDSERLQPVLTVSIPSWSHCLLFSSNFSLQYLCNIPNSIVINWISWAIHLNKSTILRNSLFSLAELCRIIQILSIK